MSLSKLYYFECIKLECDERKIMDLYNALKKVGKIEKFMPVIIIEDDNGIMEQNIKFAEEDFGSLIGFKNKCIKEYIHVDVENYFKQRKSIYEDDDKFEMQDGDNVFEEGKSIFLGTNVKNVYLAKVPTRKAYEVMAYIPMGGFSDCPENYIHMAIAKRWYKKYKAYPIAVGYDSIQFMVDKPVSSEKELEQLAIEQYLYCGNIIWQGVETLNNLKNTLSNAKVWHFWWE